MRSPNAGRRAISDIALRAGPRQTVRQHCTAARLAEYGAINIGRYARFNVAASAVCKLAVNCVSADCQDLAGRRAMLVGQDPLIARELANRGATRHTWTRIP